MVGVVAALGSVVGERSHKQLQRAVGGGPANGGMRGGGSGGVCGLITSRAGVRWRVFLSSCILWSAVWRGPLECAYLFAYHAAKQHLLQHHCPCAARKTAT